MHINVNHINGEPVEHEIKQYSHYKTRFTFI